MFMNIGPLELLVLGIVAVLVIGPERLPNLARQAAELIRTLRELSNGARQQLRDELGPEFADVDLRNLNPRVAMRRALLGDDDFSAFRSLDPRAAVRGALFGDEPDDDGSAATSSVSMTKSQAGDHVIKSQAGDHVIKSQAGDQSVRSRTGGDTVKPVARAGVGERPRPRPRPSRPADEPAGYDDAT